MIKIKDGVQLRHLQPQTLLAILIAERVFGSFQVVLRLTSGDDSDKVHMPTSLHARGFAADFGIKDPVNGEQFQASMINMIVADLRAALNIEYDVVLEKDHIHVEYDPKLPQT